MPNQTGRNMIIGYKVEATLNTPPGAASGKRIRLANSPGLKLSRDQIQPNEIRADMLMPTGRSGMHKVMGAFNGDLYVGAWDELIEAVLMTTGTAAVAITNTAMTSITTTANTIVAAGGSWLTQGVRVGDIVVLSGHSSAANNDINLRVTGVTGSVITVAGTPLVVNAVADTSFTLTIQKKYKAAATPVRRSFYVDQYYQDLDLSEVFGGVRFGGFKISGPPNGMASIEFNAVGVSGSSLASGASPYYTSPTLNTNIGLVMIDASIRLAGTDIATLTGIELSATRDPESLDVIGSVLTPDVFEDNLVLSGQISGVRTDLSAIDAIKNETELELHILLQEPSGTPRQCMSIFLPIIKIGDVSAPLGQKGAMIETRNFSVGLKQGVTGYDDTPITICSSAA
jgi:hypothetical protein